MQFKDYLPTSYNKSNIQEDVTLKTFNSYTFELPEARSRKINLI